jgi:HlyD family secretion protein
MVFRGRVGSVAVLPDANAWYANPNQRVYRTEITIEDAVPALRPGMSASVEILVAQLDDVHYVPVQSIFLDGGKTVAFVRSRGAVATRAVEVGLDDGKLVEVRSGLSAGEIVLLSAPTGFEPRPVKSRADGPPGEGGAAPEPPTGAPDPGGAARPMGAPAGAGGGAPAGAGGDAPASAGGAPGSGGGERGVGRGGGRREPGADVNRGDQGGRPRSGSPGESPAASEKAPGDASE